MKEPKSPDFSNSGIKTRGFHHHEYSLFETIRRRRSIRCYSPRPVEDEKIAAVLEAARLAPSSSNTQPWHFIVVRNTETIKKLRECAPSGTKRLLNEFIKQAPVAIVACGRPHPLNHIFTGFFGISMLSIDVTIAIEHIVLAATDLDLGTCWIGWFSETKVKNLLKVPRNVRVVALLTLGYPENPSTKDDLGGVHAKPRKALNQIYSLEYFGNKPQ